MNKKAISLLLAIFMLLSTIVSPSYAINQDLSQSRAESGDKVEYSEKGNKKIFKIDKRAIQEVKGPQRIATRSAVQSNGLRRTPAPVLATRTEKMTVNLNTKGLGNGAQSFDWSLFNNRKFTGELLIYDVDDNEYYPEKDGKRVTIDFTKDGEQTIEFEVPVGLNVDSYNIVVKTIDNFEVRATYTNASTRPSGAELKINFTVTELTNPVVEVIYKNPKGEKLAADKLPATTGVNITADGVKLGGQDLSIALPTAQYTKYNLAQGITGKGRATTQELNNITKAIEYKVNGKDSGLITLDNKEFKLSITNSLKDGSQIVLTLSKADQLKELGGLNPKTIKVWKGDVFAWKDGVEPAVENNSAAVKELLEDATVTDITTPTRDSSKAGKFPGKLQVKFDDGSSLEVDKQMLIVSEHIVTVDPNSTDPNAPKEEDLPNDKIKVLFEAKKDGGVKEVKTTGTTFVKPNTVLQDKDFPSGNAIVYENGYKEPVTWSPAKNTPIDKAEKLKGAFVFTATALKKTTAETVTENGGIEGKDLAAWVGDTLDSDFWKKGVVAKSTITDNAKKAAVEAAIQAAKKVEDITDPKRTTANEVLNPTDGTLKITFADDSSLTVTQKLYVYKNGSTNPTNPDQPKPSDSVVVTYKAGDGVQNFADKEVLVKKGTLETALPEKPNATVNTTAGYKGDVIWTAKPAIDKANGIQKDTTVTATAQKNVPTTKNSEAYEPHYVNKSGKAGETVQVAPPTFTKTGVTGNVQAPTDGTKKTRFAKNDASQTNVTVDPDTGAISVVIPTTAKVGDKIKVPVDVTYPDGSNETVEVIITVIDQENPTINQPYEGDKTINGKGEPGSEIKVELPDGTKVPGNVDENGNWTVDVPADKPLKPGDTIKATQTKNGKDKYATATVMSRQYYLTLTLDENYRGGEITHYDVYQGELIERYLYTPRRRGYVFEGWSYNSRRLDEVRPGDGIYYPTTLYAIWSKQKAKDDEDVEPVDTREVGEHKAYMFGYTDGTVRPNGYITRAEAAALVTRLLGLDTFASAAEPAFTDTPSSWYNKAINAAVNRGIMKGYPDKSFRPNAPITRAEFTQMISTIDNKPYGVAPFADVVGHWAERPIGSEYQAGRIMGYPDGTFRPNAFITRAEAVVILNKIFERNYDAMSAMNAKNKEYIKRFIDLAPSFWGFNDMVEATNTHLFKRRVKGRVEEDWVEVK